MAGLSKTVYKDKLPEPVKQKNDTTHTSIKMKPANVKPELFLDFVMHLILERINLRLMIMRESCLHKTGQKKWLQFKKSKIHPHGYMRLKILMVKKLLVLQKY